MKKIWLLIGVYLLATVTWAQQPVQPVPLVPDTVIIYYPVDTAALLQRITEGRYDIDSLLTQPLEKSAYTRHSVWHVQKRDIVLPILCLIMLAYVTWLRYTFNRELRENISVITNSNLGQQIYRDREFSANIFKLLTFINFAVGSGVLIYLLAVHFDVRMPFETEVYNVLLPVAALFFLYLIKGMVYRLMNAIFRIGTALQLFRFNALVIYHMLGIGLLPFVLLGAFAEPPVDVWSLYAALVLVGIAILLRIYKGLVAAGTTGRLHIVYFLLYICALEVAPMLIAIRLFDMWAGLQPK